MLWNWILNLRIFLFLDWLFNQRRLNFQRPWSSVGEAHDLAVQGVLHSQKVGSNPARANVSLGKALYFQLLHST